MKHINHKFDGTFNRMHRMLFSANQEQNETFTFHEMLKQYDKVF